MVPHKKYQVKAFNSEPLGDLKNVIAGVDIDENDFTLESSKNTLKEQRAFLERVESGSDKRLAHARPFAYLYPRVTELALEWDTAGTFKAEERKIVFGVINIFFKYYKRNVIQGNLEKHWKEALDPSWDPALGVTKEATGFFYSVRAHVSGDLDRALPQILSKAVELDYIKDADVDGTKWKSFFADDTLPKLFSETQRRFNDDIYNMTKGFFEPTRTVRRNRENTATSFVVTWRQSSWTRGLDMYRYNRDRKLHRGDEDPSTRSDLINSWFETRQKSLEESRNQIEGALDIHWEDVEETIIDHIIDYANERLRSQKK